MSIDCVTRKFANMSIRKTKICSKGVNCTHKKCTFAHTFEEWCPPKCNNTDRGCRNSRCIYFHPVSQRTRNHAFIETKKAYCKRMRMTPPTPALIPLNTRMCKTVGGGAECKDDSCRCAHTFDDLVVPNLDSAVRRAVVDWHNRCLGTTNITDTEQFSRTQQYLCNDKKIKECEDNLDKLDNNDKKRLYCILKNPFWISRTTEDLIPCHKYVAGCCGQAENKRCVFLHTVTRVRESLQPFFEMLPEAPKPSPMTELIIDLGSDSEYETDSEDDEDTDSED